MTTLRRFHMRNDPAYTVEAVHLTDDADWEQIAVWCGGRLVNHEIGDSGEYHTVLYLGKTDAVEGDWVVRQTAGWFVWPQDGFRDAFEAMAS